MWIKNLACNGKEKDVSACNSDDWNIKSCSASCNIYVTCGKFYWEPYISNLGTPCLI